MGEIIRLKCNKADYDKAFNIGQGMVYINPSGLSGCFDEATVTKMTDLKACGYVFDARKVLVYNKISNDYESKTVCTLKKDCNVEKIIEGMTFDDLEMYSDDYTELEKKNLICPTCGNKMELVREGFWD